MKEENNIMCFFCDIRGTFSSISKDESELKQFIIKLLELKDKTRSKEVYFNFMTNDKQETLVENINKFRQYIDEDKIKLGSQFCEEVEIDFEKKEFKPILTKVLHRAGIITEYVKKKGMDNISKVFIADDTGLNIEMVKRAWNKYDLGDDNLITLKPNREKNLNKCLDDILIGDILNNSNTEEGDCELER